VATEVRRARAFLKKTCFLDSIFQIKVTVQPLSNETKVYAWPEAQITAILLKGRHPDLEFLNSLWGLGTEKE
jgi:hypothetical protein